MVGLGLGVQVATSARVHDAAVMAGVLNTDAARIAGVITADCPVMAGVMAGAAEVVV